METASAVDQCASWDLSISSAALLDRKTSEEILPIPGVLVEAPLLSRVTAGKAKKEGTIEETHRKGGGCRDVSSLC